MCGSNMLGSPCSNQKIQGCNNIYKKQEGGGLIIRFLESKLKYDFCVKSHNFLIEKVDIFLISL